MNSLFLAFLSGFCCMVMVVSAQVPYTGLVQLLENDSLHTRTITANTGFHTIYSQGLDARVGDVLRIRAQVEMTNDTPPYPGGGTTTAGGVLRILANGAEIGPRAAQHNVAWPSDPDWHHMHHMPLWTDAVYKVSTSGRQHIEVQYAVTKPGSNPTVKIEPFKVQSDPYGHLVVEHYHTFQRFRDAQDSLAYGLDAFREDRIADADTFYTPRQVYSIPWTMKRGDKVRLFGQATSQYRDKRAFQAQRIQCNGERIGPYSTENNTLRQPDLPLWTDAVDIPSKDSAVVYGMRLHSLQDASFGSATVTPNGYLYALRYRPLRTSPDALQLARIKSVLFPEKEQRITCNAGWVELLRYQGMAAEGDVLKVSGFSNLRLPGTFTLGVRCLFRLTVLSQSVMAEKYVTELSSELPLRGEIVVPVDEPGVYTVKLELNCIRSDAHPELILDPGRSGIILEHFSREPGQDEEQPILPEEVHVHSNPAGEIDIESPAGKPVFVSLYDAGGRRVYHEKVSGPLYRVPSGRFGRGVYLLVLQWAAGRKSESVFIP